MVILWLGSIPLFLFGAAIAILPAVVVWSVQAALGVRDALRVVRDEKTR